MADKDSKANGGRDLDEQTLDEQLVIPINAAKKTHLRVQAAKMGVSMAELARQRLFPADTPDDQ